MTSFHRKAHAPRATSILICCVSPLFHLPPLLWLQGDSPGPVQKNLHNPIVQVGVPSLATQALPAPLLNRDFTCPPGPRHFHIHAWAPRADSSQATTSVTRGLVQELGSAPGFALSRPLPDLWTY